MNNYTEFIELLKNTPHHGNMWDELGPIVDMFDEIYSTLSFEQKCEILLPVLNQIREQEGL